MRRASQRPGGRGNGAPLPSGVAQAIPRAGCGHPPPGLRRSARPVAVSRHPHRVMTGRATGATMARIDRPEEFQMSHSTRRPEVTLQTVRLGKGRHNSAPEGACVMELASMLAGEPFSDHPRAVCPVIAGFLRTYNDLLPDGEHDSLYPSAAL